MVAVLAALACSAAAVGTHRSCTTQATRIEVPASWPVYHLSAASHVCVRFDRHAVYLGQPPAVQRCPAHAVGRTEAILVEPLGAARRVPARRWLRASAPAPGPSAGSAPVTGVCS